MPAFLLACGQHRAAAAVGEGVVGLPADKSGFVGYLLAYQVLTSAAALRGYGQYLVGSGRRWK